MVDLKKLQQDLTPKFEPDQKSWDSYEDNNFIPVSNVEGNNSEPLRLQKNLNDIASKINDGDNLKIIPEDYLSQNNLEKENIDTNIEDKILSSDNNSKKNSLGSKLLPHQKSLVEITNDVKIVFLKLVEISMNKENPIPYILSAERNQFAFCVIILLIGVILLLLSNILQ